MKSKFDEATKLLKSALLEDQESDIKRYQGGLSITMSSNYSLWRAAKKTIDQPSQGSCLRELGKKQWGQSQSIRSSPRRSIQTNWLRNAVWTPRFPICASLSHLQTSLKEIQSTIKEKVNPKEAPGYDLIAFFILKQPPIKALKFLLYLQCKLVNRNFPKFLEECNCMIPKPEKDAT